MKSGAANDGAGTVGGATAVGADELWAGCARPAGEVYLHLSGFVSGPGTAGPRPAGAEGCWPPVPVVAICRPVPPLTPVCKEGLASLPPIALFTEEGTWRS